MDADQRLIARFAAVFAALGCAGAALLAQSLEVGCFEHDGPLGPALSLLVPLGMAAVGATLGAIAPRVAGIAWGLASACVLLAGGLLVGGLVGFAYWPPDGILIGARDGMGFAAASIGPLVPFLAVARRATGVRARSVADRSSLVVVWSAASAAAAAASVLALPRWHHFPVCVAPRGVPIVASVVVGVALAAVVATAVAAWRLLRRARAACATVCEGSAAARPHERVDLGVGEGRSFATSQRSAYRDAAQVDLLVVGDREASLRVLEGNARRAAACAALVLAAVAALAALY